MWGVKFRVAFTLRVTEAQDPDTKPSLNVRSHGVARLILALTLDWRVSGSLPGRTIHESTGQTENHREPQSGQRSVADLG